MVHGIIIAAMLTLVGDNGSGDQVPASPQPPSHPAQVTMKAADWTLKQSGFTPVLDQSRISSSASLKSSALIHRHWKFSLTAQNIINKRSKLTAAVTGLYRVGP